MFPGAAGGNHLSNLLSTSEMFEQLFPSNNYIQDMTEKYEKVYKKFTGVRKSKDKLFSIHGTKVHFTQFNNLDHLYITDEKIKLINNQKKNILMGHAHSYNKSILDNVFVNPDDCKWLVMSVPSIDSLAGKRAIKGEFGILSQTDYMLPTDVGSLKLKESDGFTVNTDDFVSLEGWEYINQVLEQNIGITLPKETEYLHELWVKNIIEIVES
jgi:hypothetical protein